MINVLIVNQSRLMCSVLAAVLTEEADISVVGCAVDQAEALRVINTSACDVALISANLRDEAVHLVKTLHAGSSVKAVVVGLAQSQNAILCFIEAGATGYVLRDGTIGELLQVIRASYHNEAVLSPEIAAALMARVAELTRRHPSIHTEAERLAALSDREREVLELIGLGLTNREIADRLVLEVGTVKNHAHNIYRKLDVSGREDAALYWQSARDDH